MKAMMKDEALKETHYKNLSITSPAFKNSEEIPVVYTCEGEDIMPPLTIEGIPDEAKSLVLIIDDPDAPQRTWVHYVAWNIPITTHLEGDQIGTEGINDFKRQTYGGPCPSSGKHRYFFKLYALDTLLELPENSTKHDLEKIMTRHIIAFGELIGFYRRKFT